MAEQGGALRQALLAYARQRYQAQEHSPFGPGGEVFLRHEGSGRWYALFLEVPSVTLRTWGLRRPGKVPAVVLCAEKGRISSLLRQEGIFPAVRMSRESWVSVLLDGTVAERRVRELLDDSFVLTLDGQDRQEAQAVRKAQEPADEPQRVTDPWGPEPVRCADPWEAVPEPAPDPWREMERSRRRESAPSPVRFTGEYGEVPLFWRGRGAEREKLPDTLRELREEAMRDHALSREEGFYRQAQIARDYEDDYAFSGQMIRVHPVFDRMSDAQLRGYFAWRTGLRHGDPDEGAPIGFVYLYVYELLCGIAAEPREGLTQLLGIRESWGKRDAALDGALIHWIRDFVIYYDLDLQLAKEYFSFPQDGQIALLRQAEGGEAVDAAALWAAAGALCTGKTAASAFYKKHPQEAAEVFSHVWRGVALWLREGSRMSLTDLCFGEPMRFRATLFGDAIFYDHLQREHFCYEVSPVRRYLCEAGQWSVEIGYTSREPSRALTQIVREMDRQMRALWKQGGTLKAQQMEPGLRECIARCVREAWQEVQERQAREAAEARRAARPQLHLDLSLLQRIRDDADETRDALLAAGGEEPEGAGEQTPEVRAAESETVGAVRAKESAAGTPEKREEKRKEKGGTEERETEPPHSPPVLSPAPGTAERSSSPGVVLGAQDVDLLRVIWQGGDAAGYARDHHLLLAMAVDEINTAFLEGALGDVVLEWDGERPVVIEDYRADVQALLEAGDAPDSGTEAPVRGPVIGQEGAEAPAGEEDAGAGALSVYGLSPEQAGLLSRILSGGDYRGFAREHRLLLAMAVDEINEHFLDSDLGDMVLEWDGDDPVVIRDYRQELTELLGG